MTKITGFFLLCSGADRQLLNQCPTETSKYAGMGATIFFTGLFAALAGGYALFTVFDSVAASVVLGLIWGLMIFNLDRYIISSMRKTGNIRRELWMALPRLLLAVAISVVIARPVELKIFGREIVPELRIMGQESFRRQERGVKLRYTPFQDSLRTERDALRAEIAVRKAQRDELVKIAQQEADGTGGSRRRNPGPIYQLKKADADRAEEELRRMENQYGERILQLEKTLAESEAAMIAEVSALERMAVNGPAARMEALARTTDKSSAIFWAHWFIVLLFVAIETAPVVVKLISTRGPFDNLLRMEEHRFEAIEIATVARINSETRQQLADYAERDRAFAEKRLDSALE
ncbi:hypothetical protein AWW69_09755 [Bacillus cereus]|nr:hypothetical protein AWW69_09755 [Bacillus cereus]